MILKVNTNVTHALCASSQYIYIYIFIIIASVIIIIIYIYIIYNICIYIFIYEYSIYVRICTWQSLLSQPLKCSMTWAIPFPQQVLQLFCFQQCFQSQGSDCVLRSHRKETAWTWVGKCSISHIIEWLIFDFWFLFAQRLPVTLFSWKSHLHINAHQFDGNPFSTMTNQIESDGARSWIWYMKRYKKDDLPGLTGTNVYFIVFVTKVVLSWFDISSPLMVLLRWVPFVTDTSTAKALK